MLNCDTWVSYALGSVFDTDFCALLPVLKLNIGLSSNFWPNLVVVSIFVSQFIQKV